MFRLVPFLALALAALTAQAQGAPKKRAKPQTELTWWGHSAWVVKTPAGTVIAIDPWLQNPKAPKDAAWPEKVDAILVTHGHSDHVGNTVELAKKTGATVVSSFELTNLLGTEKSNGGNIGGAIKVSDDVTVHLVEAVHSSGFGQAPDIKYGGPAMGFIIQIANGPTLYHAGDTGFFKSMELIAQVYRPTAALLPIGGHFTMDPRGAALAAKMLKAPTVIPMHYGTFPVLTGTPAQLRSELKKEGARAQVLEPKPGETLKL